MTAWTEFYPGDFEQPIDHAEGWVYIVSTAPVEEWHCTQCGTLLGFWSDDEGGGGWVVPWCPTQQFDEATMRCEDCVPDEVEVGCAVCGDTGLPIIGHADTCRGSA